MSEQTDYDLEDVHRRHEPKVYQFICSRLAAQHSLIPGEPLPEEVITRAIEVSAGVWYAVYKKREGLTTEEKLLEELYREATLHCDFPDSYPASW